MGGSAPSPPTVVMPPVTTPTIYKSVTPLESYKMTGEYLKRIQEQTNQEQENLYAQSGTPAEIGARKAGVEQQAAASYLSALPQGDKYTRETKGSGTEGGDPYKDAREAARTRLMESQATYLNALQNINNKPKPLYDTSQTPSWATSTIAEGMPKA